MSAPARSIDETALSTSRVSITWSIGSRWTRTSNIDCWIVSGFRPCDIVRLPCGSRSISSTRWPCSANATPRLSVVVVFATPPFWFASTSTSASAGDGTLAGRTLGRGRRRARPISRASSSLVTAFLLRDTQHGGRSWSQADERLVDRGDQLRPLPVLQGFDERPAYRVAGSMPEALGAQRLEHPDALGT